MSDDIYGFDPYNPSLLRRAWNWIKHRNLEPYVDDNSVPPSELTLEMITDLIEATKPMWVETGEKPLISLETALRMRELLKRRETFNE